VEMVALQPTCRVGLDQRKEAENEEKYKIELHYNAFQSEVRVPDKLAFPSVLGKYKGT
jgi:hypothetical protein